MKAVKTLFAGGVALATLGLATPASAQFYPGYGYGGGGDIIGQVIGGVIGGGYGSPYAYGSPYGYGSPYAYGSVSPYGYGSPYGGGSPYAYGGTPYGYGGSPYGYGATPYGYGGGGQANQYAVGVCMGAVQQRLDASYARSQYSGGARVLGVSDVEQRSNGGTLVSGVANSGRGGTYGYNGGQPPVDLTFTCKTDRSGQVSSIEIGQAGVAADAYIGNPVTIPSPYGEDYSEYGYQRR